MAVTYATITRAATGPTPKRTFRFYPQTEGNVVTVAAQGYEHVGPFEVTTGAGGTFTIAIPLGTDQGGAELVWKITETPVDKIPGRQGGPLAAHTIGYVNITATTGYDDLIANLIDVTVVSPDLVTSVGANAATATAKAAEAAGSAAAALDSAANADSSADLADVSEANAAASASTASTAATTATTKASEASTSAATATTKASEASTSAATATTKASEASTSATAAQGYAASAAGSVSLVAWAPATAYTAGDVRQGPDGTAITRNANGTSRASFDATEEAAWTSVLAKSGTLAQRDLSATFARAASATLAAQPFLKKIKRNVEDVTLLFVGDSTMNDAPDWPHKVIEDIAPDWPTHTFKFYSWDETTLAYVLLDTIQTGSGARTVNVYSGSYPGWKFTDVLAPTFDTVVKAVQPDLTVVGLGHNEALTTNDFRNRYATGVESLTAACPDTAVICVAPNPRAAGDDQMALKAQQIERICAQRGYGFIDAHQVFKDQGDYSGYMLDAIHPNPAGSLLIAGEVAKHFVYHPSAAPAGRAPSTLLTPTENLLSNGDFALLGGSNVPVGWTATDLTITTDAADYENPAGRSLVLADAGAASISHIQQALPAKLVAGQWVTLSVRVKIASTQGASAGNVALGDSSGITTSLGESTDKGKGGWRWETVTRYFPAGVTAPYARIYADSSSVNSWTVRIDRATVTRGIWPRDYAFGAGQPGPTGPQGPAGTGAFARKSADTSRTSNALTDDPHLAVAVDASSTYELEAILFVNSASDTPDLKVAFNWPGDAVGIFGQDGLAPSGTSTAGSISRAVAVAAGTQPGSLMATASKTMVRVRGILRTTSAGTLTLQWAQAVTDATATTVYTDSFLVARKVA